jgi:hypothetical protein
MTKQTPTSYSTCYGSICVCNLRILSSSILYTRYFRIKFSFYVVRYTCNLLLFLCSVSCVLKLLPVEIYISCVHFLFLFSSLFCRIPCFTPNNKFRLNNTWNYNSKWWICKDVKGIDRDICKILSQNFNGDIKENHEKHWSGQPNESLLKWQWKFCFIKGDGFLVQLCNCRFLKNNLLYGDSRFKTDLTFNF